MGLYDTTLGTLLLGIFLNTFLYGLVTYQFAAYHRMRFNDPPTVKYMVLFLFILDTFHSLALIYMAWNYTVTNYGNSAAIAVAAWPHTFTPLGTALAALMTQLYLGFRIWRLTEGKFLYGIVVCLAIPSFFLAMVCSIGTWIIQASSEFRRITPFVVAWLSTQVIVDTFITITLVIVFSRSRTGLRTMDTLLNRLIRCAIQTGLFAGIFSIADLIAFVVFPDTTLYALFGIPVGRIYTNTLLDTLLVREFLETETSDADASVVMDTAFWPGSSPAGSVAQSASLQRIAQGGSSSELAEEVKVVVPSDV